MRENCNISFLGKKTLVDLDIKGKEFGFLVGHESSRVMVLVKETTEGIGKSGVYIT